MATTYRVWCRVDIERVDDDDHKQAYPGWPLTSESAEYSTTYQGDAVIIADREHQRGAVELAHLIEVEMATRYHDGDAVIMSHRVALTSPQVSAMECRDFSEEPVTRACWRPGNTAIGVPANNVLASQLLTDLIEASNAEDAQACDDDDATTRRHARNASLCLSRIADKVAHIISSRTAPHPRP